MVGFPYKECTISIVTIFIRYKQINRKNGCATQSLTCMKDIMALCLQIGCVGFQRILLINCCFVYFVAHFFPIQICMIGFLTFFINRAIGERGKLNYLGLIRPGRSILTNRSFSCLLQMTYALSRYLFQYFIAGSYTSHLIKL